MTHKKAKCPGLVGWKGGADPRAAEVRALVKVPGVVLSWGQEHRSGRG